MESFTLTADSIKRLARINRFDIPEGDLVLFGLRYAYPENRYADPVFADAHNMVLYDSNDMKGRRFREMSCSLGQWDTKNHKIAIFPGSTIPHLTNLEAHNQSNKNRSLDNRGENHANMLMPGYFPYKHQWHNGSYPAFGLLRGRQPIHRSQWDTEFSYYEQDDIIEVADPGDNIHAASANADTRTNGGNFQFFSAGCQVIAGWGRSNYWKSRFGNNYSKYGPYHVYQQNARKRTDSTGQSVFWYMLQYGYYARLAATSRPNMLMVALRFGSSDHDGDTLVSQLQQKLKMAGENVSIDGQFGPGTFAAVRSYQQKSGLRSDGVVGGKTAGSLGWTLPRG